jgi:competence ComEA-like helix-hairpin-helix protein
MLKVWILILSLFLMGFISASCNENQIDINTASAKELDKITGVGEAIAQRIIDNRTYNSVDDLLRVKGIGEATLAKIKAQGVACVGNEEKTEKETDEEETDKNSEEEINNNDVEVKETEKQETKTKELPIIRLNSQVSKSIKSEDNKETLGKNLPLYGIVAFCAVFGMVFFLKQRKNKHGFE